jgi:hypothetical protein
MLLVQEHGELRSYGLALRRGGLLEEMILHLLRQVTPYPNDSLAQGARNLISIDYAGCKRTDRGPRRAHRAAHCFTAIKG